MNRNGSETRKIGRQGDLEACEEVCLTGKVLKRFVLLMTWAALGVISAQERADTGPAILSRGSGPAFGDSEALMQLRPYLSLTGVYDTALTPVSIDSSGNVPEHKDYGGEVDFGVVGSRRWRHTFLGINYRGNVRKYGRRSYYDGSDHILSLGVTRALSRRTSFTLRQAAGTFSRGNAFGSGYDLIDPSFANIPFNELFDSRTYYVSPMADLTFQKSARLSFNIGGGGSFVRRRSSALIGSDGYSARGDMAYRVSRRATIGADYGYDHYGFTGGFGTADYHTAAFNASFQMGRSWELALRAGVGRAETLSVRRLALNPILVWLTGQQSILVSFHNVQYLPNGEGRLSRVFGRSIFSITGGTGLSPGNGLYLASKSQNATLSYSWASRRRVNIGTWLGYSAYSSIARDIGKMQTYHAGAGFTYRLVEWLHLSTSYSARRWEADAGRLRRYDQRAQVGLAFSPGEVPLRLW